MSAAELGFDLGTLGERIIKALHELGEPMTNNNLAEKVDTDRETLREEIKRLVAGGLVEVVGHLHTRGPQEEKLALTEKGYRVSYILSESHNE